MEETGNMQAVEKWTEGGSPTCVYGTAYTEEGVTMADD